MNNSKTNNEEEILKQFGEWLRTIRKKSGLSQEDLAEKAGFSRSYYTEIETGKRNISLLNLHRLAEALGVTPADLLISQKTQTRIPSSTMLINKQALEVAGLTPEILLGSITYAYSILDAIDQTLVSANATHIARMVELANLSSMIGNLLGAGVARSSLGIFERNGPHKYPDLLALNEQAKDIEIKVALEENSPKGHLAKEGYYLIYRYVLCDRNGIFSYGKENRGDTAYIWEARFGYLKQEHFSVSNTEGDSGKTAVINSEGMKTLTIVYCDLDRCPYSANSKTYRDYKKLFDSKLL